MTEFGELRFKIVRVETAEQEVPGRLSNLIVARAAFDVSVSLWPSAWIELRQEGSRHRELRSAWIGDRIGTGLLSVIFESNVVDFTGINRFRDFRIVFVILIHHEPRTNSEPSAGLDNLIRLDG
jgi:hypothetical protein